MILPEIRRPRIVKQWSILLLLTVLIFYSCNNEKEMSLVWQDEFDYEGMPDTSRWGYDTGNAGWGNNELQYYTDSRKQNAYVSNGTLKITALKENWENAQYTSARLTSKNKGDWRYGRIEVRAKLPSGLGIWPAIWMLPTDWKYGGWPTSGEIDIMEHVGYIPDSVFATVHTEAFNHTINTHKTKAMLLANTDSFHLYRMDWDAEMIRIWVDSTLLFSFSNSGKGINEWPFDQRFHLLLNVAVGGDWGGKEGVDEHIFPQIMEVDYVRVYQ